MKKIALTLSAAAAAGMLLSGCVKNAEENTESVSVTETSASETEIPADITDGEIQRLIEESHFIRLMTEYDTLPFEQTEPSKWQDRDYYKVTDRRFDEWNEWVEYVRTVYGESMEEQFLTDARYINVNGFTFTDGLCKGCDVLFDRYEYEKTDPTEGCPACTVKCPDALDESGESFFTETLAFEYENGGWKIQSAEYGYETGENAETAEQGYYTNAMFDRKYIDEVYDIYMASEIVGRERSDDWVNSVFLAQSPDEQEDPPPLYQMIRDLDISEEDFRKKNEEYRDFPNMYFSEEIIRGLYSEEDEMKRLLVNPCALYYEGEIYFYDGLAKDPYLAANIPGEVIDGYFDFLEDVCEAAGDKKYMADGMNRVRLKCKEAGE
ncbi:MAG: IseA DL-endopeptidase inhibitor family protein [Ruminococcus sp.]|nr:IseA DL-endopeptidase inhibitor family protein [Ruminococcus sp.]MCM1382868.1 IseA DL-endopeptidase inhibitor family protein [Muribaculaceae bacterium]MCM1479662.1 IseA DL-endopeptidase inhibitor family protein [Muribaculaceae bacterium]